MAHQAFTKKGHPNSLLHSQTQAVVSALNCMLGFILSGNCLRSGLCPVSRGIAMYLPDLGGVPLPHACLIQVLFSTLLLDSTQNVP